MVGGGGWGGEVTLRYMILTYLNSDLEVNMKGAVCSIISMTQRMQAPALAGVLP